MLGRALGLLCMVAIAGCQNAPQQFSVYAPFGPAVVPAPGLSRVNAAPYYSPSGDANGPAATPGPNSPGSTASSGDNKLSHFDPHRGILVPGFTPTPVALRSSDTAAGAARAGDVASNLRTRPSGEPPIQIVEAAPKGLGSAIESTIARAAESQRSSSGVQFQPSPPSGAVKFGEVLPSTITASPAATLARLPKPPTTTSVPGTSLPAGSSPAVSNPAVGSPASSPPGLLPPPASTTPGSVIPTQPAEPRRLSLWNDPRDGSRVEPASYSGSVMPASSSSAATGSWRQRTP